MKKNFFAPATSFHIQTVFWKLHAPFKPASSTKFSGDVAYYNEKGETFIVDRIKELIKVKGLQVPPAELEDLLHGHPGVADVAVIGIPDPKTGERPKAFVVKGDPKLTEGEIISYVQSRFL